MRKQPPPDPDQIALDALVAALGGVSSERTLSDDELAFEVRRRVMRSGEGRAWLDRYTDGRPWRLALKVSSLVSQVNWSLYGLTVTSEELDIPLNTLYQEDPHGTSHRKLIKAKVERLKPGVSIRRHRAFYGGPAHLYRVVRNYNKDFKYVSISFVTDRTRLREANGMAVFGSASAAASALSYGTSTVSFPPNHKIAALESAELHLWIFTIHYAEDERRHVVVKSAETMVEQAFYDDLRQKVAASPNHDMMLFIHGYNTSFASAVKTTAQLKLDSAFSGPSVLFSWPSKGRSELYSHDIDQVVVSARRLRDVLAALKTRTGIETLHVVAHSLGARVLTEAVDKLPDTAATPRVQELIMAAPDINTEAFAGLCAALRSNARRITIYSSSNDFALKTSAKYNGHPRLGDSRELRSWEGVDLIDATEAQKGHGYLTGSPVVLRDVHSVFKGEELPRHGIEMVQTQHREYWRFLPVAT